MSDKPINNDSNINVKIDCLESSIHDIRFENDGVYLDEKCIFKINGNAQVISLHINGNVRNILFDSKKYNDIINSDESNVDNYNLTSMFPFDKIFNLVQNNIMGSQNLLSNSTRPININISGNIFGDIETKKGDISIQGNVTGTIDNKKGDTFISGNVVGDILSREGDIQCNGCVYGNCSSKNGNIVCRKT